MATGTQLKLNSYSAIIDGFLKTGNLDSAGESLARLPATSIGADVVSYNMVRGACGRASLSGSSSRCPHVVSCLKQYALLAHDI